MENDADDGAEKAGVELQPAAPVESAAVGAAVPGQPAPQALAVSEPASQAQPLVPQAADIFALARQQNFPVALKLLEAFPQHWCATDDDGHNLVHWGALVGNREFVRHALENGCSVDGTSNNQQTPLMWAVLRGHVATAKVLLDAKAAIQHHDSLGATPLMIAIQHRSYESFLLLMHRGGDALLMDRDRNGCTSAHWAAYKGDLTALKLLDYFGADFQALDNAKMLPLHRAVIASQALVVEFLIERKSDPSQRNAEGQSSLDIAEGMSNAHLQTLMRRLLQQGASSTEGKGLDLEKGQTGAGESAASLAAGGKENEGLMKSLLKDKSFQKAFPVFWLVCVSLATFGYLIDLRATSHEVAPITSVLFELGVPASLALFAWVALSDPGKIPARLKGHSGVEELMKALDGGAPDGQVPDVSRLCTTTWVLKGLRTKYCTQTGACVEDFDHYCVWLNCAIGKNNHRQFIGLAVVEWLTQVSHLYLCWCMAWALVPYQSFGGWVFGVLTGYPLLALVALVQALTIPWVLMLVVQQCRMVAMNVTTNELMNAHRYDHFWVATTVMSGHVQKTYRNPFDKGGVVKNCLDFWWTRRRSDVSTLDSCSSGCRCHGPP